jgi:S-methylmethionine-dependent homocysteine/selenocysteine methylase
MGAPWQSKLAAGETLLIDGGTGTELRRRGMRLDAAAWSGIASLTNYDLLREIHADYIGAGAEVITTNTFGTNRFVLAAAGHDADFVVINRRAVQAAREARDACGRDVAIAGSLSCLPPRFDASAYPSQAEERAAYRELAELLATAGVDLIALEMLQDTRHAALACEAAAATGLPFWLGLSCRRGPDGRLVGYDLESEDFAVTAPALLAYRPSVVTVMHSPIDATRDALTALAGMSTTTLGAYPEWSDDTPAQFARTVADLKQIGAQVIGGCCGTRPEHIRALEESL